MFIRYSLYDEKEKMLTLCLLKDFEDFLHHDHRDGKGFHNVLHLKNISPERLILFRKKEVKNLDIKRHKTCKHLINY